MRVAAEPDVALFSRTRSRAARSWFGGSPGRTVSLLSHLDWNPPGAVSYAFTAITYGFSFGFNSVLIRFWVELLHGQRQGAKSGR